MTNHNAEDFGVPRPRHIKEYVIDGFRWLGIERDGVIVKLTLIGKQGDCLPKGNNYTGVASL